MRIQIHQSGLGSGTSAGVSSFNGRTGPVVASNNDYSLGQISGFAKGSAIVPTGASFLTITHGLSVTPSVVLANLRIPVGGNNIFCNPVDSATSQAFTVSLDASTESNLYKVDYLVLA